VGDVLASLDDRRASPRPSWDVHGTLAEVRCASSCSLVLRSRSRRLRGQRVAVVDAWRAEATAQLP